MQGSPLSRGAGSWAVSAFSLVEVALAIGVVAFAFVGLLGLLPVGLDIFRESLDTSTRAHIAQRVIGDAQQTDFGTLRDASVQIRFFDDEGTEVEREKSIYAAILRLKTPGEIPQGASSPNLATITVEIAKNPAQLEDPFQAESKLPISKHVGFVARNR